MPRKRARDQSAVVAKDLSDSNIDASQSENSSSQDENNILLRKLRNTWEFACLIQFLFLFGKTLKIKDIDLDDLENACLGPTRTERLAEIGIALLKFISGTKSVSKENFELQASLQYDERASSRNPFRAALSANAQTAEESQPDPTQNPVLFSNFDLFEQIKILHQLTVWTFVSPERIRNGAQVADQTEWRIEPFGWDGQDRSYFLLDDDRLYRMSDKPKLKSKSKYKSKKRRVSVRDDGGKADFAGDDNLLGDKQWECIAITLDDYHQVLAALDGQGDPNEKILMDRIRDDLLPVIEKKEAERKRLELRKIKELETQQRLATAKRSTRLAERRRREEEKAREENLQKEMEAATDMGSKSRPSPVPTTQALTRDQRWRRRYKIAQKVKREREQLAIEVKNATRVSRRQLDKKHRELDESLLVEFDCICGECSDGDENGVVSCQGCQVEQHANCVGYDFEQQSGEDFECAECLAHKSSVPESETEDRRRGRPRKLPLLDQGLIPTTSPMVCTPSSRSVSNMSVSAPIFPPPTGTPVTSAPVKHTPQSHSQHAPPLQQPGSGVSVCVPRFQKPAEPLPKPAPTKHDIAPHPLPIPPLQLSPSLSTRSHSPVSPTFVATNLSSGPGLPSRLSGLAGLSPAKARVASMPLPASDSPGLVPPLTLQPSSVHPHTMNSLRTESSPSPPSPTSPVSPTVNLSPGVHTLLPPSSAGLSPRKVASPPQSTSNPRGRIPSSGLHSLAGSPSLLPVSRGRPSARSVSMGGLGTVSDIDRSGLPAILSSSPLGKSPIKHAISSQDGHSVPVRSPALTVVLPRARARD